MLGMIASHQNCYCGEELSRKHAIECSKVKDIIFIRYPNLRELSSDLNRNIVDIMINQFRSKKPVKQDAVFIGKVIRLKCISCFSNTFVNPYFDSG